MAVQPEATVHTPFAHFTSLSCYDDDANTHHTHKEKRMAFAHTVLFQIFRCEAMLRPFVAAF